MDKEKVLTPEERFVARVYAFTKLVKNINSDFYSIQAINDIELKNQDNSTNNVDNIFLHYKEDGDFSFLYNLDQNPICVTYNNNIFNIKDNQGINVQDPFIELHHALRIADAIKQRKLNNYLITTVRNKIGFSNHQLSLCNNDYIISRSIDAIAKKNEAKCSINKLTYDIEKNTSYIKHSFYINPNYITRINFHHGQFVGQRIIQSSDLSNELIQVVDQNFTGRNNFENML
jgi:hypothetical protein